MRDVGAVVAVEPSTGGVLAFVSTPSFDPNPFVSGVPSRLYRFWREHPDTPLYNRASQGIYPPASTIKPFAGMGGLHYGLVDWDFKIQDRGRFSIPVMAMYLGTGKKQDMALLICGVRSKYPAILIFII